MNLKSSVLLACGLVAPTAFGQVLSGNYLSISIDDVYGTLQGTSLQGGIQFDPTGTGTFPGSSTSSGYDFTFPGTPWEFWAVESSGVVFRAQDYAASISLFTFPGGKGFNATTEVDDSSASGLRFRVSNTVSFDDDGFVLWFTTELTNLSDGSPRTFHFARGLDPDQDANLFGDYDTLNRIDSPGSVTATGPTSRVYIGIRDSGSAGRVSIYSAWGGSEDPQVLFTIPPNDGDGDNAIAIAYRAEDLGQLNVATWSYSYLFGVIPEPRAFATVGGLLAATVVLLARRRRPTVSDSR